MSRSLAALAFALAAAACEKPAERTQMSDAPERPDGGYIGTATMAVDGTIVLDLATFDDAVGGVVHARVRYAKDHPQYAAILAHIGPLGPEQSKPVKPWPR